MFRNLAGPTSSVKETLTALGTYLNLIDIDCKLLQQVCVKKLLGLPYLIATKK